MCPSQLHWSSTVGTPRIVSFTHLCTSVYPCITSRVLGISWSTGIKSPRCVWPDIEGRSICQQFSRVSAENCVNVRVGRSDVMLSPPRPGVKLFIVFRLWLIMNQFLLQLQISPLRTILKVPDTCRIRPRLFHTVLIQFSSVQTFSTFLFLFSKWKLASRDSLRLIAVESYSKLLTAYLFVVLRKSHPPSRYFKSLHYLAGVSKP